MISSAHAPLSLPLGRAGAAAGATTTQPVGAASTPVPAPAGERPAGGNTTAHRVTQAAATAPVFGAFLAHHRGREDREADHIGCKRPSRVLSGALALGLHGALALGAVVYSVGRVGHAPPERTPAVAVRFLAPSWASRTPALAATRAPASASTVAPPPVQPPRTTPPRPRSPLLAAIAPKAPVETTPAPEPPGNDEPAADTKSEDTPAPVPGDSTGGGTAVAAAGSGTTAATALAAMQVLPPPRPAVVSTERRRQIRDQYVRLLRPRIAAHFRYPDEADAMGVKGLVVVIVTIDPSGCVRRAEIAGACVHPWLCQAALATVREAAPFPPPPAEAGSEFEIPLAYDQS